MLNALNQAVVAVAVPANCRTTRVTYSNVNGIVIANVNVIVNWIDSIWIDDRRAGMIGVTSDATNNGAAVLAVEVQLLEEEEEELLVFWVW